MKFLTESGSYYELNSPEKLIRRLIGIDDPQPRQGNDGEWKSYVRLMTGPGNYKIPLTNVRVGANVVIVWEVKPDTKFPLKATETSRVVRIDIDTTMN